MINLLKEISNLHQNSELFRKYTFEILQAFQVRDRDQMNLKYQQAVQVYRLIRQDMYEIERKLSLNDEIQY